MPFELCLRSLMLRKRPLLAKNFTHLMPSVAVVAAAAATTTCHIEQVPIAVANVRCGDDRNGIRFCWKYFSFFFLFINYDKIPIEATSNAVVTVASCCRWMNIFQNFN